MLFGSFFAAYYFARVAVENETWPPDGMHLPVYLALLNTIILVTSSFTVHWAIQSIKRENRAGLIAGLGLTILLGLTFLLIQAREYTRLGFAPKDNAFATTFFGLTGLHGLHVFVGLNLLLFAFIRSVRGHYSAAHHHGVELPGIYWHFVDVMWIVVYVTVYVI
jgi:cytochrome c oxidase subunit 3